MDDHGNPQRLHSFCKLKIIYLNTSNHFFCKIVTLCSIEFHTCHSSIRLFSCCEFMSVFSPSLLVFFLVYVKFMATFCQSFMVGFG